MQINSKGDTVTIKLTQAEGRRMRDAAYITRRIAANLTNKPRALVLMSAADLILGLVNELLPAKGKLDREDADTPPAGAEK